MTVAHRPATVSEIAGRSESGEPIALQCAENGSKVDGHGLPQDVEVDVEVVVHRAISSSRSIGQSNA
jgi:hypothetical protein